MDINSLLSTMLSSGSVNGISQLTGSSNADVANVLASALPSLLGGAEMQATQSNSGFEQALVSHAKEDTSNLGSFMSGVDMNDGAKILGHLLGANTAATTNAVAKKTGVSNKSTASILSAAAPLLMSLLGQQTQQSSNSGLSTASLIASLLTGSLNSGNSSLLGSLLGGGQSYSQPQQSAGNSLLSALLGGGQPQQTYVQPQQTSAANSLLGALLGGGSSNQSSGGLDLTSLALSALTGSSASSQPVTVSHTTGKKKKTSSSSTSSSSSTTAKKKKTSASSSSTSTAKKKKTSTAQAQTTAQNNGGDVLSTLINLLK